MPDFKVRASFPVARFLTFLVWLSVLPYLILTGIGLEPTGPPMSIPHLGCRLHVVVAA